jgi:hypothetical protein
MPAGRDDQRPNSVRPNRIFLISEMGSPSLICNGSRTLRASPMYGAT